MWVDNKGSLNASYIGRYFFLIHFHVGVTLNFVTILNGIMRHYSCSHDKVKFEIWNLELVHVHAI
jgi:hypothetical protein